MLDFAAIDFETANNYRGSACSVGVVVVRGGEITQKMYELIRPRPNFYSWFNTRIHGLATEDTDDAPEFPEVWGSIAPLIEGLPMVAHNSPFDKGCLEAVFALYEMAWPGYVFHCTCRAARRAFPALPNHKLGTVAAHIGFDLFDHHHALADAEACAAIAMRIL
ncbi:MAG: exonuclease domain-containing protein [Rikenellaceae bacterium]|nr:exonuclease domain-containing protein [Rikenellaceae bacterium]MCL2692375.1 exonuclease domain-containing protein [Rikenellaceae bacterium]